MTKKLKLFQKLTSNAKAISLTCPKRKSSDPIRYNGEVWEEDCFELTCDNGVIKEKWTCKTCKDSVTDIVHRLGSSWTDTVDICQLNTCAHQFDIIEKKNLRPCQTLTCSDRFDPIKSPKECCPKCASDTCDKDKGLTYLESCKRTCNDGPDFVCKKKEKGCWCPLGKVEDKNGNCIDLSKCPCISGRIVYQPGQTAIRSSCSTCVCLNAEMVCFERC